MSSSLRPVLSEHDLGADGWRVLHEDAVQLGRRPNRQVLALVQWAIKQRLDGKNVELTSGQRDRLLGRSRLETVA